MSFSVDQVGKPVLVKTSYFPNWRAEGADGPYRVSPNLMVVVPTAQDVTLTYGRTWVEALGAALSLLGLAIVVALLARLDVGELVSPATDVVQRDVATAEDQHVDVVGVLGQLIHVEC